jgi:triosephosphate isomerase
VARSFVAGNWKMFKGPAETAEFCAALRARVERLAAETAVAVCPPFVSLPAAVAALGGSRVRVYAQNVHWAESGAFTGEVSAQMLLELGVDGVVVGHSERRQYFGETDETAARRAAAALEAGLAVIACVGELEAEREAGRTKDVLRRQVSALADAAGPHERLLVAYEPVWAIGTGRTATPELAQEAHAFIRTVLDRPVLYGGSVKPDNALELLSRPGVDGALVGGASLEVGSFTAICEAAVRCLDTRSRS